MVSVTTKQHVSLNSDVLYNHYPAKFPVTITRDKKGKKDVKINTSWKNINSNTCTGNEKWHRPFVVELLSNSVFLTIALIIIGPDRRKLYK
jgi:Flp pilus assembly protein TadG